MGTKHTEPPVTFRRLCIILLAAAIAAVSYAGSTSAQEKPLIEKWLDGEVRAKFAPVTYNGPPIELRYSTFIGEFGIDVRAFKRLEAETNGKLVVKPYWGNTLANMMRGPFEAVSGGVADFGNCYVRFNLFNYLVQIVVNCFQPLSHFLFGRCLYDAAINHGNKVFILLAGDNLTANCPVAEIG